MILFIQVPAFATLPTYTLPEKSLEKLKEMPDPNQSLNAVYNNALKGLEDKGFGENNFPKGFGELKAPEGFGVSANELYKEKFGSLWFESAMDLSAVNANISSKPANIKIDKNVDLTSIYSKFAGALNTGAVADSKSAWLDASSKFEMPSAKDLAAYKPIDTKALEGEIRSNFDMAKWGELRTKEREEVGGSIVLETIINKTTEMYNGIKDSAASLFGLSNPVDEEGNELPNYDQLIMNNVDDYDYGYSYFNRITVKDYNEEILVDTFRENGFEIDDNYDRDDIKNLYKENPWIYDKVKDKFFKNIDEVKAYEKSKK